MNRRWLQLRSETAQCRTRYQGEHVELFKKQKQKLKLRYSNRTSQSPQYWAANLLKNPLTGSINSPLSAFSLLFGMLLFLRHVLYEGKLPFSLTAPVTSSTQTIDVIGQESLSPDIEFSDGIIDTRQIHR